MPKDNSPTIVMNPADNVAVARAAIMAGAAVGQGELKATQRIGRGHKVALAAIPAGAAVRKYDQIIGFAKTAIVPGEWVHEHNCAMQDLDLDYAHGSEARPVSMLGEGQRATWQGFKRGNGKVGTRNYLAVISTVNCSATVSRHVADRFNKAGGLADHPKIDGVVALTHGTGCGLNIKGEGYDILARTIWGYANNPNFGGVVVVGLGCEGNQISYLKERYGITEGQFFRTLTIQDTGGTQKTIAAACDGIRDMLGDVNAHKRSAVTAADLTLALQCGGSDGYSGISANPALGVAADMVVKHGGTAILSETPEIYGAEHLLTRRARNVEVGKKLVERIDWWRRYCDREGAEMNNNPSPGNKLGGLTTILEKSLGAVAKSGTSPLNAVYEYAEPVTEKGFVYVDTPGHDPVCSTGQIASGANIMCFTTGRGNVQGYKPVPTLKLATNSDMYERMKEDMDMNCGTIVTGEETIEQVGQKIFDKVLKVASGERTWSEKYDYGDNEFVPWHIGAVM